MDILIFVAYSPVPLLAAASACECFEGVSFHCTRADCHSLFTAWISLDISGQSILEDAADVYYSTVPVMIGTPPQRVDMTINTYSSHVAAFAHDCLLCGGSTFFDQSLSSSFGVRN